MREGEMIMAHTADTAVIQATPNAETIVAMKEANRISKSKNVKKYSNFSELLKEIKAEMQIIR